MRTKKYTLSGIDVSAAGIAAAQAPTSGTALTLTGAAASLSPVRFITLASAANLSAITFTVVGTDRWGNAMTEAITGPNNSTVTSKGAYASVTSITPNGTSGSNLTAGWPVGGVSPWVLCALSLARDNVGIGLASVLSQGSVAATGNFQVTYDQHVELSESDIKIDMSLDIANTPVEASGRAVRVVLTSGAGSTAEFRVTRPLK